MENSNYYFNCNDPNYKLSLEKEGKSVAIGKVKKEEVEKIAELKKVAKYMTKNNNLVKFLLQVQLSDGKLKFTKHREFQHGETQKKEKKKSGRKPTTPKATQIKPPIKVVNTRRKIDSVTGFPIVIPD
mgnify:CR=1 FL=1